MEKRKILLVEDDEDIANLVKLVLETESYIVKTVLDPMVAIEKAKEYRPDAIVLDLKMPGIDGWKLFKLLRKDKEFDSTPIAILTAKAEEFDTMVGLYVMNADAYIKKPFGKQELIDQIHDLFKK